MKEWIKRLLISRGLVLVKVPNYLLIPTEELSASNYHVIQKREFDVVPNGNPKHVEEIRKVYALMREFLLGSLPPQTDTRTRTLASLIGVTPEQAIYIVELLSRTSHLEGTVFARWG